jgi:hypothetical protein
MLDAKLPLGKNLQLAVELLPCPRLHAGKAPFLKRDDAFEIFRPQSPYSRALLVLFQIDLFHLFTGFLNQPKG